MNNYFLVLFNLSNPKTSLALLITVCHTIFYDVSSENFLFDQQLIDLLADFFANLITCLPDIVRRNSVLVTHGG